MAIAEQRPLFPVSRGQRWFCFPVPEFPLGSALVGQDRLVSLGPPPPRAPSLGPGALGAGCEMTEVLAKLPRAPGTVSAATSRCSCHIASRTQGD